MGRTGENKQKVHRAPEVSPELWRTSTAKQKAEAIASYKAEPEPERGPAAAADSGVRRLRRINGAVENGLHRDKIAEEPTKDYPCRIARKLFRKEMDTCPKAKKALDAEWENL